MQIEDQLKAAILGRACSQILKEPEMHSWTFHFGDQATLNAACPWRIIFDRHIAYGYEDDGQWFGLPAPVDGQKASMQLLFGRQVSDLLIRSDAGDLSVEFEGGARLELFNASSGYEGWAFSVASGSFIGQGGGNIVHFTNGAGL